MKLDIFQGYGDIVRSKPKKKKNSRKAAKLYADLCCREYAHARFPVCVTCGKGLNEAVLQWGHLLTSVAESTRWDIFNFAIQCSSCNLRHEFDPSPFPVWFINRYGADAYRALAQRHHTPAHFKTADLIEIGNRYKRLTESLTKATK